MSRPRKDLTDLKTSIYEGADGYWHAKVPVGRRDDGTIDRAHLKARTEAEIEAAVALLKAGQAPAESPAVPKAPHEVTLAEWVDRWLNERLPLEGRAHKTIYGYRSDLGRHVLPVLGDIPLWDITGELLERHFGALSTHVSGHTLVQVYRAISSCFTSAIKAKAYPGPNPCRTFTIPRPEEPEVEPYTLEEARAILKIARDLPNAARWSVALSLGFRQNEALGLKWTDIDLVVGTLSLRNGLNRAIARHGCGQQGRDGRWACGYKQAARCQQKVGVSGLVDKKLKTKATKRTIPLPPSLLAELKAHRERQDEQRRTASKAWVDGGYVFATPTGRPLDPARDWQAWKALTKAAGVPDKRLHDARHTAATLLLAQGIDSRTVMVMLGWSEQRTANRYTHVIDALKIEAARSMEHLWAPDDE